MKIHRRSGRACSGWKPAAAGIALLAVVATPVWAAAGPHQEAAPTTARVVAAAAPSSANPKISIMKHKFSLPTVTVPVGGTVTWVNQDEDLHTVVSTAGLFRSPGLDTDETYSYKFTKPGVYQYFCTLHPLMVGKVVVK
jgi:amicyanin